MTVQELNELILRRPLKLDLSLPVKVIREDEEDILVEVEGRKIWRAKRKHIRTEPKKPHAKKVEATSSMPAPLKVLNPYAFMMYHWILSLDSHTFSLTQAGDELNMNVRTVKAALDKLESARLIKVVDKVLNVGYTVEVTKE